MATPGYIRVETGSFGQYYVSSIPGAPVAYTWQTGAIILDPMGKTYVCTAGGSPGTWSISSGSKTAAVAAAAAITYDASLASTFDTTLAGAANAIAAPLNPPAAGFSQRITIRLRQDATGSRTVTWNAAFHFTTTYASPTLTTAANKTDIVEFLWNSQNSAWECVGISKGA